MPCLVVCNGCFVGRKFVFLLDIMLVFRMDRCFDAVETGHALSLQSTARLYHQPIRPND